MKRRSSCIIAAIAVVVVLAIAALAVIWAVGPEPRYARIYNSIGIGASEKEIRAGFAPLKPWYFKTFPYDANDPYVANLNARTCLLVIDHRGWHYQFYLDWRGRVVATHRYWD